jgi:signal transduction histidine kinase
MTLRAESKARTPAIGYGLMLIVIVPVLGALIGTVIRRPDLLLSPDTGAPVDVFVWMAVIATVELLPVPLTGVIRFSLGFPILLGVAILYSPMLAGLVALVGAFDARELRREITPLKALFNRCQIALSTLAESAVFHSVASVHSPVQIMIPAVLLATGTNYLINTGLVTSAMLAIYGTPVRTTFERLRVGGLLEFLVNYVGLGLVGLVLAVLFDKVQLWSVAAFILPLVFARQMLFRSLALEVAGRELKDRERVLRALSNRMAEERQDERMQIAAYLHDDLAQMLFRLALQVDMAKKRLRQGETAAVFKDLDGITETKEQTSGAIRSLIRDLHRSPIGRKGLGEAIQSFAEDISKGHPTTIVTDVVEVSLPPPIQLLIYQIAREAAMNALKHAEADHIWITVSETEGGVELQIRDDGKGFDTSAPPPEGHFGSVMMRERALVAGGTYNITSQVGEGATIRATFPQVWVEEGSLHEATSEQTMADGLPRPDKVPPRGATAGPSKPVVGVPRQLVQTNQDSEGRTSGGPRDGATANRSDAPVHSA